MNETNNCAGGCHCGGTIDRRQFLRLTGAGTLALLAARLPVMAGPFTREDFEKLVPADKKLDPNWVKSLYARGEPTIYRGPELNLIGLPIGGLCAGQLYLGGDGKLWHWDIFNQHISTAAAHYAKPPQPSSPFEQGFALTIGNKTFALDKTGFSDIRFRGEYPLAVVDYQDPAAPVTVRLEAFSPFIPLNTDDSSLPATVLQFSVKNVSSAPVTATLTGALENAICLYHREAHGTQRNRIVAGHGFTFLECAAEKSTAPAAPARPDIVFEDWHQATYDGWTAAGTAFGTGPIKKSALPEYQGDVGGDTERVVNSHATAPGDSVNAKDNATGKLTSRAFKIERNFITFWY